jgi:polyisoprenoid-binding protein YceI
MNYLILAAAAVFGGFIFNSGATKVSLPELARYRIDASKSTFMVYANRTGLLWFKGHSHRIAVRDFSGEASVTANVINPASLQITVKAESLEETDPAFTQEQKNIINKELKEIVLHPDKFPEITFQSTRVALRGPQGPKWEVEIDGNLTLHGVTKPIRIPATVSFEGNDLHAAGEFDIDRDDFGVKATSAFHGTIRVKNNIKFVFDIIAERE